MSILVTGGAGFIGSHICERLLEDGKKVICLDNFNDFYDPATKESNISGFTGSRNFTLYRQDILNSTALDEIFAHNSIDAVIHLAARAGVRP